MAQMYLFKYSLLFFIILKIKAFQLDYLSRASEVKDPVHKYPLTHHLAEYMIDHYTEGSDMYSELGSVSRSSRVGNFF